jgi:hypothetical protein
VPSYSASIVFIVVTVIKCVQCVLLYYGDIVLILVNVYSEHSPCCA